MIWILLFLCFVLALIVLIQGKAIKYGASIQVALVNRCGVLYNLLDDEAKAALKKRDGR